MIGNDIIDLALAEKESNWQRKGFLHKLFTAQEQSLIKSSINQEITIWNLWSRKEAAYKIYNRQTGIRKYNPIQFECFDLDIEIGKVVAENQVFYTKTEISSEYIYTIAATSIENLNKIQTVANTTIIQKAKGIPWYINENQILNPISKTHHGRFERIISIT